MNPMPPCLLRLPRASLWLLQGLLLLTLATLLHGRVQAQELVPAEGLAAALVASEAAAAPRLALPDRVGLALNRLGQQVLKLVPWHRTMAAPPSEASTTPASLPGLPGDLRNQWELKAAPEPMVALVQLSRPTVRLSSDAELSLRLVGGVGVMLKTRF